MDYHGQKSVVEAACVWLWESVDLQNAAERTQWVFDRQCMIWVGFTRRMQSSTSRQCRDRYVWVTKYQESKPVTIRDALFVASRGHTHHVANLPMALALWW